MCNDPLDCIGHDLGLVNHHSYVGLGKWECGTSTKWSMRNSPPSLGSHECHLLGIFPYSIFVLGNRWHEERCCFPTDFNVQLNQLQTLCIRGLFHSSKNKPLEHYIHNVLLTLDAFFLSLSYYKGQGVTEWLLMVSHNTIIVLSLTEFSTDMYKGSVMFLLLT